MEIFNEWGNELDYEVEDDFTDDATGEKKKKSGSSKNKGKKQEDILKKRKDGILPEFIEVMIVLRNMDMSCMCDVSFV